MADCRPTICLSMIVRDEAQIVREVIDSVAPHIDYWVIVDTGSTDATIETICQRMAAKGLPGDIHERPWRDFGSNRTEALTLCRGRADYVWVIDADDLVVGDLDLSRLCADSYLLRYGDEFRYWRRQIFRDGLRWRYQGVVHEYPICLDPATEERLEGEYHIDSRRLGARSRLAEKYERDCLLLRETVDRDPDDARSVFYLAQSHFDAGDCAQALEWYTRRAEMGGWGEEVSYSLLRRAACLTLLDEPWDRTLAAYLEAWQARPTRAEPLYEIARHYRLADSFELGYLFAKRASEIPYPEEDSLFTAADIYGWRTLDELAICAYYTGRHEESFECSRAILDRPGLPESERARVEGNSHFCVPWMLEQTGEYPAEVVGRLDARACGEGAGNAQVTLTISSCRRPVLFERTVNSFLRCCSDLERIGRWICVDNGSAEVDRARMRELYPFMEFIYTDPQHERHADSMNHLRESVTTPYWLHLEDDWQFFWRGAYVERALAILADDPAIAQVAFNRNYAETLADSPLIGGEVRRTAGGKLRYVLHEHLDRNSVAWERHRSSLPPGFASVAYWPHFTLRPSLMRSDAIKSVGPFLSAPGHFELEFADRYAAAGLKTAFLDAIDCVHTGRLTTHQSEGGRISAYELVGDGQHPANPATPVVSEPGTDNRLRVAVINLDRRPDRLESFRTALTASAGPQFASRCERFAAIDGTELAPTPEIEHQFRGNDFAFRRGIVGCALSHIEIWRSIAERDDDQAQLVFEDDAQPADNLDQRLGAVMRDLRERHPDFEVVLLGFHPGDGDEAPMPSAQAVLRPMRWERYVGGLFAYLISGRGARKLLELADRDGIQNGIDTFVALKGDELSVLECDPPLVIAPRALTGNGVDSDIQHDYEPIPVPETTRVRREIAVYDGPNWVRWSPRDIERCGLGGANTVAYRLAESLSARGYAVTLYGECDPNTIGGVAVKDWRIFDPTRAGLALVCSADVDLFDADVAADKAFLWLHDVDIGDRLTPQRAERIDRILCLSGFHREHVAIRYPFVRDKLATVRNGIEPSYFESQPAPERAKRVLYTSSFERGLGVLLELWPLVRERVPDAELFCTQAPVYERVAKADGDGRKHREQIQRLAEQPGVRTLAGLAQPKLAQLMRSSLAWAHPSYSTRYRMRFKETSCISAMEAQAAGCCVIAANWGALPDTVRVGTLIDGDPTSQRFRERFADAIVAGLTDAQVQATAQTEGPQIALGWSWDGVAEMIAEMIEPALVSR